VCVICVVNFINN